MHIVGITGGIGSGKTTICRFFEALGIPVYYADKEANALMHTSKTIQRGLKQLFGKDVYKDNELNKDLIRSLMFKDVSLLKKVNAIVHPEVGAHFKNWVASQTNVPYVLKEAAIIFENQLQDQYDDIITVVAEESLRISRVMKRDQISEEAVRSIIRQQLPDEEKIRLSDYVITNENLESAKMQVADIHQNLLNKLNKT